MDIRFLNGYMYLSPVGVTDPAEIEARVPEFAERAGYYFANWDRLYAAWMPKVRALIDELEAINFSAAAASARTWRLSPRAGAPAARSDLLTTYHRLVDLTLKLWHYHFEFLNLGYAAYLDFFGCCKQLFPSIPDQAIAKMVAGIQVDLFQPDEELKKLAQLAVELGLADRFAGSALRRRRARRAARRPAGRQVAGGLGGGQAALVQLLGRQRLLPQRQGVAGVPGHPARLPAQPTSPRSSAARRWSGRWRPSSPSATGSWPSTPS